MSEAKFQVGQPVSYETWDGEEGRSYGWCLTTKKARIVSIFYKLDNGEMIEEKKLVPLESKSEATKATQNGSSA